MISARIAIFFAFRARSTDPRLDTKPIEGDWNGAGGKRRAQAA
jgi:hypothetical protein